jgi:hypothetical protein
VAAAEGASCGACGEQLWNADLGGNGEGESRLDLGSVAQLGLDGNSQICRKRIEEVFGWTKARLGPFGRKRIYGHVWRNYDLAVHCRRCLLSGNGKAGLYGRDAAHSGR